MKVIRPSFGYVKVQLQDGENGYVASEDIRPAAAALVDDGHLVRSWKSPTAPGETNGRRPQGDRPGSLRASNDH